MRGLGNGRALVPLLLILVMTLIPVVQVAAQTTQRFQSLTPQQSDPFSANWLSWAATAWSYFAPGIGVNTATGLHMANLEFPCFTDWDLGTYITAIIYAYKLGLIASGGPGDTCTGSQASTWGFTCRIQKVLNFLENRPLYGSPPTPYDFYSDSESGGNYVQCPSTTQNAITSGADTGRLLVALNILESVTSAYDSEITGILDRTQSVYQQFASTCCNGADYYAYLMGEGYQAFAASQGYSGCNPCGVFMAVDSYSGPYFTFNNGQKLPEINTLAEPLNLEILLYKNNNQAPHQPSPNFLSFANAAYSEQDYNYTNVSGNPLAAWTEGGYAPFPIQGSCCSQTNGVFYSDAYTYEWVLIDLSGTWNDWQLTNVAQAPEGVGDSSAGGGPPKGSPILVYTKAAFSYLAIYGENAYTEALANAVSQLASSNGFGEAALQNGQSALSLWQQGSNSAGFYTDKTNEQVLDAAYYAVSPTITSLSSLSGFSGDASGQVLLVIGDLTVNGFDHGSKCCGVGYQVGRDTTPLGFISGMLTNPQPTVFDDNTAYVNTATGRPTTTAPLIFVIGGDGVNEVTNYYETTSTVADQAPLTVSEVNGNYVWTNRAGTQVASVSASSVAIPPGNEDVCVIEILTDASGRMVVILYGVTYLGVWASAWYFKYVMYPNISAYTDSYYIIQWTAGADFTPDASNQFTILAQGIN